MLCKSIDWFLYDSDLRHEIIKHVSKKGVAIYGIQRFMLKDYM